MNLTAQYSATDIKQAALMSRLSGVPARVQDDIFVWNGILIDRASAVVALLKIYNQVPISTAAKTKLHSLYSDKFSKAASTMVIDHDQDQVDIWFYKLCKTVQGEVKTRTPEEVKQILIGLHQR